MNDVEQFLLNKEQAMALDYIIGKKKKTVLINRPENVEKYRNFLTV